MASDAKAAKAAGKGGLIVTVAVLTVLAAAGGGLVGKLLAARAHAASPAATEVSAEPAKPLPYSAATEVRELPAIVTNLAQPADSRVRIQVAIVFAKGAVENPNLLAAKVNDDVVAFIKTLSVAELQGPAGLQALREDLNERAAVRSDGKVRELIIEALVIQ